MAPSTPPGTPLQAKGSITPFWLRIPRFFLFPAQFGPLWRMALLSVVMLVRPILPVPEPLDYILLLALAWLAFLRYAYVVLDQTSLGHLDSNAYELLDSSERQNRPYKQWVVFMVLGGVLSVVGSFFGQMGFILFNLLFSLCLPASIMVIAVSDSIAQAINPKVLLHLMRSIGWRYLALCFFLDFLSGGGFSVFKFLFPAIPSWLWLPLGNFLVMYYTLIMFNMMGYVLYEYHDQIGLEVQVDFADNAEPGAKEPAYDAVAEQLSDLLLQGQVDDAIKLLQSERANNPNNIQANARLFKLLLTTDQNEAILEQGQRLIALQMGQGQHRAAALSFLQCRKLEPSFQLKNPALLLPLAEAMRGAGDFEAALDCLREIHRKYGDTADMPKVVFLSARILCEDLHQDAKAAQVLHGFLNHFPEDPLASEVRHYLKVMDRLAAQI